MESVLIGVDQSTASRRAVEFALSRARINGWRAKLVHVISWSPYTLMTPEDIEKRPVARKDEIAKAQELIIDPLLAWIESDKLADGIDLTTEIRHGRPSETLSDIATEEAHDMVIVARTGQSDLRNAIFGSTASRLAQHSPVPTLIVP